MSKPPSMSGRARRHLHRKSLVFGPILLVIVALIALAAWLISSGGPSPVFTTVLITLGVGSIPGTVGIVLTLVGVLGERKARRINREDWTLAEAIADRCEQILQLPPHTAYNSRQVRDAAPQQLLEVERHFDARTAGDVRGAVMHQFSMFGTSLGLGQAVGSRSVVSGGALSGAMRGLSDVHLTLSSTTRSELMGDAICALFETRGAEGHPDTLRVTALSNGAVQDSMRALVQQTVGAFGLDTHSGVTVNDYAGRIAAHFAPGDVSYLSDRLHLVAAQTKRGEVPPPVAIRGVPAGRGAVVVTSATIGDGPVLQVFPTAFPQLWGTQIGEAIRAAEQPQLVTS